MNFPFTLRELPTETEETEKILRKFYPGIQVRFCGLQYGPFPHQKRSFHANVLVDGLGWVMSAQICNSD